MLSGTEMPARKHNVVHGDKKKQNRLKVCREIAFRSGKSTRVTEGQ